MDKNAIIEEEKEQIIEEARKEFQQDVQTYVRRIQQLSEDLSRNKKRLLEMEFVSPDVSGI